MRRTFFVTTAVLFLGAFSARAEDSQAGPCATALRNRCVCEAANAYALDRMKDRHLEAIIVMQDVATGALAAFAASDPAKLDVTTAVLPLSTVKVMAAAVALDHEEMKIKGWRESEKLLDDAMVVGNDNAGRRIVADLRTTVGRDKILQDLERYGFPPHRDNTTKQDTSFWAELALQWRDRLVPGSAYHSLGQESSLADWANTLSIGEERSVVTALHLSRFLQAIGNGGTMLPPVARTEGSKDEPASTPGPGASRVMSEAAATELQAIMREAVERGTATSAKPILAGTGWSMGGKTGTGPEPGKKAAGPQSDGCFAGLIFDPQSKARFTVVTFVKHGGFGGENAAQLSAELGRFLAVGESTR